LDNWTTYFTSFLATSSMSNSNFVWAYGKFLFKMGHKSIFHVICNHVAKNFPRVERQGTKKEVVLPIESWIFILFSNCLFCSWFTWCHLQCGYSNLNAKSLIFSKKICKFHNVGVLSQDPINKKNCSSLIVTNLSVEFKSCMFNLI
jgi:hypothetical protein